MENAIHSARLLREAGVAPVYTPVDFDLTRLMGEVAGLIEAAHQTSR